MLIQSPSELPDLSASRRLAIDLETRDPNLKTMGQGDLREDGHVAGIAVAVEDGPAIYAPIGHGMGKNLAPGPVIRWMRDLLDRPNLEITGARFHVYDRAWLKTLGIEVRDDALLMDTQIAEPLIDEQAMSYDLNSVASRYLGVTKDEQDLYQWLADRFGGRPTRNIQAPNIWRAPPEVVHDYAISDVRLPLQILRRQEQELRAQDLDEIWRLELDVAHVTFHMRQRGVRIDLEKTERLIDYLEDRARQAKKRRGRELSVWSQNDLAALYDKERIEYPRTPERINKKGLLIGGTPSFPQLWLAQRAKQGCELSEDILAIRQTEKAVGTFLRGYLLEKHIRGRVHAEFNQLKGDDGGTVTGRFSCANPNLQNIPTRTEEGNLIRGLFVAEEEELWYKHDYAQIEPRLTLHYAPGPLAEEIRRRYWLDPSLDSYQALLDEAPDQITRKVIKTIWLGLLYGMGRNKLAVDLGVGEAEADHLIQMFHEVAPYVKSLKKKVENRAKRRGYIHTILGRRARFNSWEPADFNLSKEFNSPARGEVVAWLKERGHSIRVRRSWTHKSLNRLIQGGSADIMKRAMVRQWREGVWDVLGPPLVTVHDENDWSVPQTREGLEAIGEAKRIMAEAVQLRIPLYVDEEKGPNWGEVKE